jgi:hypothetical protein
LVPISQEKRKERTNKYVNFQAESVALPADAAGAAGRPGQAKGNNLNLNGGLWHEVRVSR